MVQINISHPVVEENCPWWWYTNGRFALYIAQVSYPSFIESGILFSVKWIHTLVSSEYTTTLGNHLQYLTLSLLKRKILNRNNIINSFLNALRSFNPSFSSFSLFPRFLLSIKMKPRLLRIHTTKFVTNE